MASSGAQTHDDSEQNSAASCCNGGPDGRGYSTQTEARVQGHVPRLSKFNLFTLLSLWMERFPNDDTDQRTENEFCQTRRTGLVVVRECRVVGLHCSGAGLHAGQAALIRHGPRLATCELYFSRRPCATCLKMIINAGVSRVSFWPGDPEVSLLSGGDDYVSQEAVLDAAAVKKLKSNSRPHICVLLEAPALGLRQYVDETSGSRRNDFMARLLADDPGLDAAELFREQWRRNMKTFLSEFLVLPEQRHRGLLARMDLENLCVEPYFSGLRQNMEELVKVLASVCAGVPVLQHGFYRAVGDGKDPQCDSTHACGVSQEIARHCAVQARLLSYRTEDPKVGVGAVIWAERKSGPRDGTGRLYLLGCGYNAYPVGSAYAEYPQMDTKQQDRQRRKYRYIVHAEQNALTFRSAEIREEENTMMFVTMCPCDECVPLIRGAGIKQIYTTDLDSGKDKVDISYLRFSGLTGVHKFIWQKSPHGSCSSDGASYHLANGCLGKRDCQAERETQRSKKARLADPSRDCPDQHD